MKKTILGFTLVLSACSTPSPQPTRQVNHQRVEEAVSRERPTIGTPAGQRWYAPQAYESKDSWSTLKDLYLQSRRFSTAYQALDRSGLLFDLVDVSEAGGYRRDASLADSLRPRLLSAWTLNSSGLQRYDSRIVFELDHLAENDPVPASAGSGEVMADLSSRIHSLKEHYLEEKSRVVGDCQIDLFDE